MSSGSLTRRIECRRNTMESSRDTTGTTAVTSIDDIRGRRGMTADEYFPDVELGETFDPIPRLSIKP